MGLREIGAKLPPGFRFHPSDEELVCHYLCNKIKSGEDEDSDLVEIDLHVCEPWQLPDVAKLNAHEWYFFSFRDRKYATGYRTNRATTSGYWKATGKDRTVVDPRSREIVGMRKTLVFYKNRAPNGIKTCWIMHEFRLEIPNMPPKEDWVLCRVFHKSKPVQDNTAANSPNQFQDLQNQTIPNQTNPNHPYTYNYTNMITQQPQPPTSEQPYDAFLSLVYQTEVVGDDQTAGREIARPEGCGGGGDYGGFFGCWDVDLEKTEVGRDGIVSELEDRMGFEIDDSIVFQ